MSQRTAAADNKKKREAGSRRTRGRPTQEDAVVLEGRLLDVALREFLQRGYGGASMSRIVQVAGVSKTTLYSRHPSKEALFRAIIRDQISRLAPSVPLQSASGAPDLERGLIAYANHLLKFSLEGDLLGVDRLIHSECHNFPELGAAAAERTALGVKRIVGFIRECAQRDGIPCKNPKAVAEIFIFAIRGWYINVMLTNCTVSPAQRERWVRGMVHTLLSSRSDW